jgi:hypothetical protein
MTNRHRTRLPHFLLCLLASGLLLAGCDSGGEGGPTYDDLTGTVSGQVVDAATSDPVEGATVTVTAGSLDAEAAEFTTTTGPDGQFSITDVPVTTGTQRDGETPSARYGVRLETPDGSAYRDTYRGHVELAFGNTGDGPAGKLVANMTFPLNKANGTVAGQVKLDIRGRTTGLREGVVALEQSVPVQFDADGTVEQSMMLRTTDTTDAAGRFAFNRAEVGTSYELNLVVGTRTQTVARGSVPAEEPDVSLEETVDAPPFEIVDVTPAPGGDVDTTRPGITFTFNRAVAANEFARADAPRSGLDDNNEGAHLVDELILTKEQAKSAKALTPEGTRPVDLAFNEDRTELTVTPGEPLQDGFNYRHVALGFEDDRFVDAYGIPLAFGSRDRGDFTFSVGVDEGAPAVPTVSFDNQAAVVAGDTLQDGTLDYTDATVAAPLEIDTVDHSDARVKGYEVYYRAQNQTGRSGNGDQFVKVTDVSPEASPADFEDAEGIIPADAADTGQFGDGVLEFRVAVQDYPFAAEDGSYGPIEWKVRAVSINNVRGDFSPVITTGDNTAPSLQDARVGPDGSGGDTIVLAFSEAVDTETASRLDNYTFDNGGDGDQLSEVVSVENVEAQSGGFFTRTEVTIDLEGTQTVDDGDEIVVTPAVQDLAGNGMNPAENSATF